MDIFGGIAIILQKGMKESLASGRGDYFGMVEINVGFVFDFGNTHWF